MKFSSITRPWHTWAAFGLCLIVVLAAMGWTSLTVLRLEEQSRTQAVREENVRLALWRMDSALAPLLAHETSMPYFAYGAFYPAERPYADMFNVARNGEMLLASPLLTQGQPHALLYFQFDPNGQISSPQVPPKAKLRLAQKACAQPDKLNESAARLLELQALVSRDALLAQLPEEFNNNSGSQLALINNDNYNTNNSENNINNNNNIKEQPVTNGAGANQITGNTLAANPANTNNAGNNNLTEPRQLKEQQFDGQNQSEQAPLTQQAERPYVQPYGQNGKPSSSSKSSAEWQRRERSYQDTSQALANATQFSLNSAPSNTVAADSNLFGSRANGLPPNATLNIAAQAAPQRVSEGVLKPLWVGSALVLARRVSVGGKIYIQGCWLNWPWLQEWLLSDVRDLLPAAALEPAPDGGGERAFNMLAGLPAKLTPGSIIPLDPPDSLSPVRLSLIIAWGCALLAAGAVASLLFGTVRLSERRATFVSSVTHELRTPLTTFRIYAEMLAGGMVPSEEARRSYLDTLRAEAERLSHLVENVLAYARLERGSARSRVESVDVAQLLETVKARLHDRAAQAGMQLALKAGDDARTTRVTTDVSAVEQILFNLVDNACKYAAGAEKKEITLSAALSKAHLSISVCDKGPGFSAREAKNLFKPFSKSARQAAHSAPGVGLGLALSRRLARDLGGDLRLDSRVTDGACFELRLPLK